MRLEDEIALSTSGITYDDNGDPVQSKDSDGTYKCAIVKNERASVIKTHDGEIFQFSYSIYLRKPKVIPDIGASIHITKKDKTIDEDCVIADRMTMRNWLRIWV